MTPREPRTAAGPYRCPVCNGTGRMMPLYPLPTIDPTVTCVPCKGSGVLWAEAVGAPLREALDRRMESGGWDAKTKAAYEWGFTDCMALAATPAPAPLDLAPVRLMALSDFDLGMVKAAIVHEEQRRYATARAAAAEHES